MRSALMFSIGLVLLTFGVAHAQMRVLQGLGYKDCS